MKIELKRDWSEFLSALIAHRVRFVLVGGHAVAGHAEPRFTEDLDVFVEPSLANASRLRAALVEFGFGTAVAALSNADLARPERVFMLGRKPDRIDILLGIDGVTFAEAWASRVEAEFISRPLFVIGREALIRNKRAANRAKDQFDLAMLAATTEGVAKRSTTTAAAKRKTAPTTKPTHKSKLTKKARRIRSR